MPVISGRVSVGAGLSSGGKLGAIGARYLIGRSSECGSGSDSVGGSIVSGANSQQARYILGAMAAPPAISAGLPYDKK